MKGVPLTSVAAKGGLVGGPFGSSLVGNDYRSSGVPVIRGTNMGDTLTRGPYVFVDANKAEELGRNNAVPGDLVFTQRGTLGQVCIAGSEYPTYVISQSQMRLRVDTARFEPRFVLYACKTAGFRQQIDDSAIATGVPHINLGILGRLKIPELIRAEQAAIAEVLGALDDKIAANRALVDTVDALAVAAVKGAARGSSMAPLRDLADVVMGSSPPGVSYNECSEGIPFFQGVRDFDTRTPRRRVWTTQPVRRATAGDILVSVRAPVGRANIAEEDCCIGRGLAAVRGRSVGPATLFYQLRLADWAPFEAEGTIFGSISGPQLGSVLIPKPSSPVEVESQVAALEALVRSLLRENRTLAALRDTLLPEMMSGRIRVREAERAVEEVL